MQMPGGDRAAPPRRSPARRELACAPPARARRGQRVRPAGADRRGCRRRAGSRRPCRRRERRARRRRRRATPRAGAGPGRVRQSLASSTAARREVAAVLLELRLEPLEERERVGRGAGEARPGPGRDRACAPCARRAFMTVVPERHLPVAGHRHPRRGGARRGRSSRGTSWRPSGFARGCAAS